MSVKLATHNCSRVHDPSVALRLWFDLIEPGLLIHELNSRATIRKNGYPVVKRSYVSYYDSGQLRILVRFHDSREIVIDNAARRASIVDLAHL